VIFSLEKGRKDTFLILLIDSNALIRNAEFPYKDSGLGRFVGKLDFNLAVLR
jgi:hypothetical protein